MAASSKNYRTSVNMQVLIDADTRLVVAVGQPTPGNHNDCTAWTEPTINQAANHATVLADGGLPGHRPAHPHRRKAGQVRLRSWKEHHNTAYRRVRARVEHTLAAMKCPTILRDCRRKGHWVYWSTAGVAHLHNLALTG